MCATCGCGGPKATFTDLRTGRTTVLGHDHHHAHQHVHADGTIHTHDHDHNDHEHHSHAHSHHHDHSHDHGHDHHHHHEHIHADGTRHSHAHDQADHNHAHQHRQDDVSHSDVSLEARVLAKNDARAEINRAWLKGREVLALNLVSSPGSGKTTLLERTIRELGSNAISVIEGDQATANDGDRIRAAGAPCVQVNTGTGCHLDADMVAHGLAQLKPGIGSIVMIENVGNLVCPALFDLGEQRKVVILSVTEGEDKPLKYPHMFKASAAMILNKIDLSPHVDFDADKAIANARTINPGIEVFRVSARTGEGLDAWYDWIRHEAAALRDGATQV